MQHRPASDPQGPALYAPDMSEEACRIPDLDLAKIEADPTSIFWG